MSVENGGVSRKSHRFPIRPLDRGANHDYVTGLRSRSDPPEAAQDSFAELRCTAGKGRTVLLDWRIGFRSVRWIAERSTTMSQACVR